MASISDNFNRSDEDLDGSTASGGGTWVEFENSNWEIVSNAAYSEKGNNWQDHSARLDGVDFDGDDHEVEVTITIDNSPGGSYLNVGPLARKEDNATKTFYTYVFRGPSYVTRSEKFIAGSYTALVVGETACAVNDTLRIKCDGDQISGYLNDVLEVGPTTDSSIAGAGYIQGGLFLDGGSQPGNYSVDDFSGADLAAAGRRIFITHV